MKQVYFVLSIILLCIHNANAESWEHVIPAVEKQAAFYIAEADRLGYANTSKTDVDYLDYYREDHECGILGRMFGLDDLVADYEHLDTPRIADNMTDIELIKLFAAGRTLESWVRQAKQTSAQTKMTRVARWNDNCANNASTEYVPTLLLAAVPSFVAYPTSNVSQSLKPAVMPDFDGRDRWARLFRTRIRDSVNKGANFAGHYAFTSFGCGASCIISLVTDTKTGQVFQPPFGGEKTPELNMDFRLNSTLIQVVHIGDTTAECKVRAWSFDGKAFNLEGEDSFVRAASCNNGQKIISK